MSMNRSNPETVATPIGSYSHAVRVESDGGTWLYVSGQIANDLDGQSSGPVTCEPRPSRSSGTSKGSSKRTAPASSTS